VPIVWLDYLVLFCLIPVKRVEARSTAPAAALTARAEPGESCRDECRAQVATVRQLHIGINPLSVFVRLDCCERDDLADDIANVYSWAITAGRLSR
jgi:hypothetical protein